MRRDEHDGRHNLGIAFVAERERERERERGLLLRQFAKRSLLSRAVSVNCVFITSGLNKLNQIICQQLKSADNVQE